MLILAELHGLWTFGSRLGELKKKKKKGSSKQAWVGGKLMGFVRLVNTALAILKVLNTHFLLC